MAEVNNHEKYQDDKCVLQLMKRNSVGNNKKDIEYRDISSPLLHHKKLSNVMNFESTADVK